LRVIAIYHLNHRAVGKSTSLPGTAAAKVRYMLRQRACENIVTVGLAKHPKALERAANENEHTSRKNGRVCDTFIIALPIEMTEAERVATTRSFLWQLTDGGRARAFAAFHAGKTQPHIHVMYFDRDVETGKRVQKMSDMGSTERMRQLWERVCNSKLEEFGYEARIDHRTLDEQMIDRYGPIERCDDDNPARREEPDIPPSPATRPTENPNISPAVEPNTQSTELPLDTGPPEMAPEDITEADMADAYITTDGPPKLSHERVHAALEHDTELRRLTATRERIVSSQRAAQHALEEAQTLMGVALGLSNQADAAERNAYRAGERLKNYTRADGSYRGFRIKIWKIDWKSPARQQAEALAAEKSHQEFLQTLRLKEAEATTYSADVRAKEAEDHAAKYDAASRQLDQLLQTYGEEADFATAETILNNSVAHELEGLRPHEIYADYELGNLSRDEATRAFEILGEPEMIATVEQRHREELRQEAANDNQMEI
jgi:MobA/MobL family